MSEAHRAPSLLRWIQATVSDPRGAAQIFSKLENAASVGWVMAFTGMVVFSIREQFLSLATGKSSGERMLEMLKDLAGSETPPTSLASAELMAIASATGIVYFALLLGTAVFGARSFGGRAESGTITVIVGWYFLLYALWELVVMSAMMIAPGFLQPAFALTYLAGVVYLMILLVRMISEAHGFENPIAVFFIGLAIFLVMSFFAVLAFQLMTGFTIAPPPTAGSP